MLIAGWPAWRDTSECAGMQGDSTPHPETGRRRSRQHLDEQRDGQADDIEEASLDVRHECRSGLLDRVTARAAAPLAARDVLVDRRGVERPEAHRGLRVPGLLAGRVAQRQAGDHVVGAPCQQRQHPPPLPARRPACRAPGRRPGRACRRPAPSPPRRPRPSAPCRGCAARRARAAASGSGSSS